MIARYVYWGGPFSLTSIYTLEEGGQPRLQREIYHGLGSGFRPYAIALPHQFIDHHYSHHIPTGSAVEFTIDSVSAYLQNAEIDPTQRFLYALSYPYYSSPARLDLIRFPVVGGDGTRVNAIPPNGDSLRAFAMAPITLEMAYAYGSTVAILPDRLGHDIQGVIVAQLPSEELVETIQWSPNDTCLLIETRMPAEGDEDPFAEIATHYLVCPGNSQPKFLARGRVAGSMFSGQRFITAIDPRSRTVAIAHLTSTHGGEFLGSELQVHSLLNPGDKAIIPVENLRQFGYTPGGDLWFIGEQP